MAAGTLRGSWPRYVRDVVVTRTRFTSSDQLVVSEVTASEATDFLSRATLSRRLLPSCMLASAICLTTATLAGLDLAGACRLIHPLFWLTLTAGSLGVAGSTFISLWRIWAP
jgi:hypothetical protein